MQRTVKVFVIPLDRAPSGPPDPPREVQITAPTMDALRLAAHTKLSAAGYRVRSLSFGPTGLVAYVEVQP